eukprot:Opistho-2@25976
MSLDSLPFLYFNLCGEMMYILQQRLFAQAVELDKAKTVLNEVACAMFDATMVDEVFKLQEQYTLPAARMMFEELAHASIMRLDATSLDKLYDLMVMGVKYQLTLCEQPRELLDITSNHLNSVRYLIADCAPGLVKLEGVLARFKKRYGAYKDAEFQRIRQSLFLFFQDKRTRVSLFLEDKLQSSDATFFLPASGPLPKGFDVPGTVRYFGLSGSEELSDMLKHPWKSSPRSSTKTITDLGLNLYRSRTKCPADPPLLGEGARRKSESKLKGLSEEEMTKKAREEVDALGRIMGTRRSSQPASNSTVETFKINLFSDGAFFDPNYKDDSSNQRLSRSSIGSNGKSITIDASRGSSLTPEMLRILDSFSIEARRKPKEIEGGLAIGSDEEDEEDIDDLLDLMDIAG